MSNAIFSLDDMPDLSSLEDILGSDGSIKSFDLFDSSFPLLSIPAQPPIKPPMSASLAAVKAEPLFDWTPSQASVSPISIAPHIPGKSLAQATTCGLPTSHSSVGVKADLDIPEQGISFLVFQQDPIHCTSRFSIFLYVHKRWREQFLLKDQVKANIYKSLRTYCIKDGDYAPQDSCPKPCNTWLKNYKKKPSTNGIIQIKQVRDAVDDICGSQDYEKTEIVCKLLCSTPTHYQSQLFIAMDGLAEDHDLVVSPPFEFLARKDPHKNKRKIDSITPSPPASPPMHKRRRFSTTSNKRVLKAEVPSQACVVERSYTSTLSAEQLWELVNEFHAYLKRHTNGLLAYEAEVEDNYLTSRSYYDTPEDSMQSVELSVLYILNSAPFPNKYRENLKKSGKLRLISIKS